MSWITPDDLPAMIAPSSRQAEDGVEKGARRELQPSSISPVESAECGSGNWTRSVVIALGLLTFVVTLSPVYAESNQDPRDLARAWRLYRNPLFERTWGVDILGVRLVSSNWMLQFKYHVIDPEKAKLLLDRTAKPYLTDKTTGAMLAVPAMENIGELRQATSFERGRDYFIIFGNANKVVQRGGHVTIEIGAFRAEDLVVE